MGQRYRRGYCGKLRSGSKRYLSAMKEDEHGTLNLGKDLGGKDLENDYPYPESYS